MRDLLRQSIIIVFLFFGACSYVYSSVDNSKHKIDSLNQLFASNYKINPNESLLWAQQALKLARKIDLKFEIAKSLGRIGVTYKILGNFQNAHLYYNEAQHIYRSINDSIGWAKIQNNLGNLNLEFNKYPDALENYMNSLNVFEASNRHNQIAKLYNNIGLVYKNMKVYDQALKYYKKSLEIKETYKISKNLLPSYINLANLFSQTKNFYKALEYHQKCLEYLQKYPNSIDLAKAYQNLGSTYLELKNYDLALQNLLKSLRIKQKLNNRALLPSTYSSIAYVYYKKHNLSNSLKFRLKSLQLGKEIHNLEIQKNSHEQLFRIYTKKGESKKAIHHFKQYSIVQDSLINQERIKQIAEMQEKYESEKKEQQIALLEKENQLQEIEVEKKNKEIEIKKLQRNSLFLLLLLIIGLVSWFSRSYFRNKRFNKLLNLQKERIEWHKQCLDEKNKELEESNRTKNKLFQIISHDLRSPLATVADIAKLISFFIAQNKTDELQTLNRELDQSVHRVLNLTDNLLSWSLNQSGRLPYQPEVIDLSKRLLTNIDIYRSVASRKNIHLETKLPESINVYADRNMLDTIVRNLINNALKFTPENGQVTIGALPNYDSVVIWVKDNGTGIPSEKLSSLFEVNQDKSNPGTQGEKGNGLGLILCKEFVERNKGEISVESRQGEGSTFKFTLPLYQKEVVPL